MTAVLAIDPGVSGAAAWYDGTVLVVDDLPTYQKGAKTKLDLAKASALFTKRDVWTAIVELVGPMPRQGLGSCFNFGFTTGAIHGVLAANGFTIHTVTPQVWKFGVGLNAVPGQDQRARKNASRARACELFPDRQDTFARAKDDGRAEAALMAWWFIHKSQQQ